MNDITIPMAVWLTVTYAQMRDGATEMLKRLADDRGVDDSVSRLIWIVTGVAIALAATAVAVAVFNNASSSVNQNPVAPTP
jgi:hypothetical protein